MASLQMLETASSNNTCLFNADECFLAGPGAELIPMVKIDGRVIGTGKPGHITKDLVTKYKALTHSSGEPL
jgi:branched-chain amino acid aminotransferase